MSLKLSFKPLTKDQWNDFVSLFGERGACGGCWCMLWRLPRKQFEAQKGEGNKLAMKTLINSGEIPGILCPVMAGLQGLFGIVIAEAGQQFRQELVVDEAVHAPGPLPA